MRKFELESHEEALRLEARIKKLPRSQKELLAAGDDVIASKLLESLGETLAEKSKRLKKSKRVNKSEG